MSDGEIVSFVQADHIISIDDSSSGKTYIAIEASFVGDTRGAQRAIRNANIINVLTGANSYAVVAGCYSTDGLLEMAERGEVIWHLMPEDELQAHRFLRRPHHNSASRRFRLCTSLADG